MDNLTDQHEYLQPAGIRRRNRSKHLLAVGSATLTTTVLMTFCIEDILDGFNVVWIGNALSSRTLLEYIPGPIVNHTIFFAPGDALHRPVAWNLLKNTLPDSRYKVAEMVTSTFGSIYSDSWGPQSSFLLRTAVHANLDLGNTTLLGCLAMLSNTKYRAMARKSIKDPIVRGWWDEFERWPDQQKRAATAPLQNKLGSLLTNLPVRNILGQVKNKLEVGAALQDKLLVVSLDQKHLGGTEMVRLFGSLVLSDLTHQSIIAESHDSPKCYVYIEAAHTLAPEVLQELVGSPTVPISVAFGTSHLSRLNTSLERALMASCGAILAFRSSYADALRFHQHFGSLKMKEREFVDLGVNQFAVKLPSGEPYWSELECGPQEHFVWYGKANSIVSRSLDRFGTPRAKVEQRIRAWANNWLVEKKK